MIFSIGQKKLVRSILAKSRKAIDKSHIPITSLKCLFHVLNKAESGLIKEFLEINPQRYGFRGKFLGIHEPPRNLVSVEGQAYVTKGKSKIVDTQYVPAPAFKAYQKLNQAFFEETRNTLLICSGYRSPAAQALTFLQYLQFYKYDFIRTVRRVAMPGYSEHGDPWHQAVDFMTADGVPTDARPLDFARTKEYRWLSRNAGKFRFYLSYPRKNRMGVMFEPWHWQFKQN